MFICLRNGIEKWLSYFHVFFPCSVLYYLAFNLCDLVACLAWRFYCNIKGLLNRFRLTLVVIDASLIL